MLFILTLYQFYGVLSMLWLLVVVASTDIGAYAVGKSIGKTPFSKTSPNKTMEGVVGGVVSIVSVNDGLCPLSLPATSLNEYLNWYVPSVNAVFGVNVPAPES